jgi:WD40 repeat protein
VPITRFCDERQLSPRERLELLIPVCHAIQHAHQKGVIHRDIKPTNVLVALYDDRPVPKVIDFGVAKAAGSQLTDASLVTGFGAIVGTPEYMSPEQAQLNQLDIDTRSDVYALGVLLYELLTGTTPIDRKRLGQNALLEMLRVIREEEPPRPSTRLSTSGALPSIAATRSMQPAKLAKLMRGELDWIVMKCLEKDRSRRYETANGLARDLERYLHDDVVEAQPPSAAYRLRKFIRKHRTALTTAVTIVLLLVAGVAVSAWLAVRATQAEGLARGEKEKTAKALNISEQNRKEADAQRQRAEAQVASLEVDIDLHYCEHLDVALGLLRLAETLKTIPEPAKELRECVALNILAWGQNFCPAIGPLKHDGYAVTEALLSPDGQTVLTSGNDGTARLWDSLTGKQRAVLTQAPQGGMRGMFALLPPPIQFSDDGSTALTMNGNWVAIANYGIRELDVAYEAESDVRLWDVATGQLRMTTPRHAGNLFRVAVRQYPGLNGHRLSRNGSLLVTACRSPNIQPENAEGQSTVFFWNGFTGHLIRKLDFQGPYPWIDVNPDGTSVLISQGGVADAWFPEESRPPKRLPGGFAAFSPSGRSAVTVSKDMVYWWNSADWHLHREIKIALNEELPEVVPHFITDDILVLAFALQEGKLSKVLVVLRNKSEPIEEMRDGDYGPAGGARVSSNGRFLVIGGHVYDVLSGQRLFLPRGRSFQPELSQLTDDGRFPLLPNLLLRNIPLYFGQVSFIVDLAADKPVGSAVTDVHLLKNLQAWVGIDPNWGDPEGLNSYRIVVLRKADANLDVKLLNKWCQVITRGKLDDNGRFSKFDEATWEKSRLELALLLDASPNAQSLHSAVTDRLYWLRQEIMDLKAKESSDILPALDRLVVAEPTWLNYSQRGAAHAKLGHWDLAIRDDLEAARLAGQRYWLQVNSIDPLMLGARAVQVPGRPPEQYELALRWMSVMTQAGVTDNPLFTNEYAPRRTVVIGLAQYRLGRYAEALAALQSSDIPKFCAVTRSLMSPGNVLTVLRLSLDDFSDLPINANSISMMFAFDPVDLMVRAMCHHHLGHPKEGKACLQLARGMLGNDEKAMNVDHKAFLNEAESLIEGKPRP